MAHYKDKLREIWAGDASLVAEVPVTTTSTNRFFDSPGELEIPADADLKFTVLDNLGSDLDGRNSACELRSEQVEIRIVTPSKALTESLFLTYISLLKGQLNGTQSDFGRVGDAAFTSRTVQAIPGGGYEATIVVDMTVNESRS